MLPVKITTDGRILTASVWCSTSIATYHFAMDSERNLSSRLEELLAKCKITDRGPLVYVGGGWHERPDEEDEKDKETEELDIPSESYLGPGTQAEDINRHSPQDALAENEREVDVDIRFETHPPESLITQLEDYHFEYKGIDPDLGGIDRYRQNVARSANVFETLPPELTGKREWTPTLASLDTIDWSPQLANENGLETDTDTADEGDRPATNDGSSSQTTDVGS